MLMTENCSNRAYERPIEVGGVYEVGEFVENLADDLLELSLTDENCIGCYRVENDTRVLYLVFYGVIERDYDELWRSKVRVTRIEDYGEE